jgi:small subunit ribosomal protein S6
MSKIPIHTYEGLFLFPASVATDLKAASDHVYELLARADAQVISFAKWDERRLAYDIKGNKRGVYFLTYFKAAADQIANIEKGCNLSERLLRGMVTRADHVTDEQIEESDGQALLADEINLRDQGSATPAPNAAPEAATEPIATMETVVDEEPVAQAVVTEVPSENTEAS